jgi:hypothetical protein
MSDVINNIIAYKVLYMLVTPFKDTDAYKLGIIDENGKNLIKPSKFKSYEQKEAYSYLHRLVFNMKKLLARLPGGDNRLKSIIAALYLIKEYHVKKDKTFDLMEDRFNSILKSNAILAEELVETQRFFEEKYCDACDRVMSQCICDKEVDEEAPTNSTGAAVSTDRPAIRSKDIEKYKKKNASALLGLATRK